MRATMVALIRGLDAESLVRVGTASGLRFTVRSFAWIVARHELHHRRLLRDRYGLPLPPGIAPQSRVAAGATSAQAS